MLNQTISSDASSRFGVWDSEGPSRGNVFGIGVVRVCVDGSGSKCFTRDGFEYSDSRSNDERVMGR